MIRRGTQDSLEESFLSETQRRAPFRYDHNIMNDHSKRASLQTKALGKVTQGRRCSMKRGQCFLNTDEGNSLKRQGPAENGRSGGKIINRFVGQQSVAIIQIKQPELLGHSAPHHPGKIGTKLVPVPETGTQAIFCQSQPIGENRRKTQK